ncbi:DUF2309 domain-containing protein [Bradyrhizobium sp. SK17]|jgi:uncharacterized protein YbcC (UPF0753/DUF2309 family)|uniref:YbcC family protein n=1 Tax=Alphaproteobacteria TaxID=28211 RepID=UPI0006965DC2|nr:MULTISPECIES: DUF2309 domain-containing protein [Alphaproteobacteria]AUC94264.1 DUF2309 domain-containing protein [Bradyrhizobium sp. SK17]
MSIAIASETGPRSPIAVTCERPGAKTASIEAAIAQACDKIAPLWPLKHFVAVNPFLGFSDQSFAATCATLRRVAGVDMLMPRAFYRQALAAGTIEEHDLEAAMAAATSGHPAFAHDAASLRLAAARDPVWTSRPGPVVATVAEVLDGLAAGDRQASRTAFMVDEISKWCAAYFDEGQAAWKLPSRALPAYTAWRAAMRFDRNPETMGIRGFRKAVAAMPKDPREAIAAVVLALGIPDRAIEDYLHRALIDIGGWAAYARYLVWDNALYGRDDDTLVELLAIRVVWGYALFLERPDTAFTAAWAKAMADAATLPKDERLGDDPELALDLILHEAYEAAYRRRLLARLSQHFEAPVSKPAPTRKAFQAAFCIDVRSEVYRRALETVCPDAETIGFAGFFGFPIEYVPIGRETGGAQCPVLLKPAFVVCEAVANASEAEEAEIMNLRLLRRRAAKAWKAFKLSAVSSFTYVETVGLLFAAKLVGDSARLTRTVSDPNTDGLDKGVIGRIGPRLEPGAVGGRVTGFDDGQRVAMAEAVLRAMSMTQDFARLVLLTGHGSTTVNNPHASGLDCGACGGHTGEANARIAAAILNDPGVRVGLAAKGIDIPKDSWFIGCLHDTTTDEVRIFDADRLPASHAGDLARLREALAKASSLARDERAQLLGIGKSEDVDRAVRARSRDWAQVRPEWGLAGNAAFIAAPRERTRGLDLAGRAFLHDYDWQKDAGFSVLELIMTAPMVVASWINLQYYASTVNNRAFGSGNKLLHNVVGQLGVLEGNTGDLKVGLPWQSVHDGTRFVHEPLRLTVFIEAPEDALNRVIEAHASVRQLIDNGWVHLFRLGDEGWTIRRYAGDLRWEAAT